MAVVSPAMLPALLCLAMVLGVWRGTSSTSTTWVSLSTCFNPQPPKET